MPGEPSLLGSERGCSLRGCRETYDRRERDFWEVKGPEDLAFGERFCSLNCAKTHLMRVERQQGGAQ